MANETRDGERARAERRAGPDAAGAAGGHSNVARFLLLCAVCALLTGAYAWFTIAGSADRAGGGALAPILGPLDAAPGQPQSDGVAEAVRAQAVRETPTLTDAGQGDARTEDVAPPASTHAAGAVPTARSMDPRPVPGPAGAGESARADRLPTPTGSASGEHAAAAPERRFLVRHTGLDRSHGFLAVETEASGKRTRRATPLMCHRLHFAAGHGSCLVVERQFFTTYTAVLFDAALRPRHRIALNGIPSRTRVSPDGRHAAITVFVSGHSYADSLFSTETGIVDTDTGALLVANLEELPVIRDGEPFHSLDFNFWGVTFSADGERFFATLGTGGVMYLVEGSLADRTIRVVTAGIECPALSPDETRIAFKKRMPGGGRPHWHPHVLDLETLEATPLAETRNVDDQVEWLDDESILYALPEEPGSPTAHVWAVPADGSGRPAIFLEEASSPTVLRPGASVTTAINSEG